MWILAQGDPAEIAIEARRADLHALADLVRSGSGRSAADNSGEPHPYDLLLGELRVTSDDDQPVRISADLPAGRLDIRGGPRQLEILAANLDRLAGAGRSGEHQHIEYFPDHFYLAADSVPLVLTLRD